MSRWWMHAACAVLLALGGMASAQQSPSALPALESRVGRTVTIVEPQQPTEKATVIQVWRMKDGTPCMMAQSNTEPKQLFTLVENTAATSALDRIKVYRWSKEGIAPSGCPVAPANAIKQETESVAKLPKVEQKKTEMVPLSQVKPVYQAPVTAAKSTVTETKESIKTVSNDVVQAAKSNTTAVQNTVQTSVKNTLAQATKSINSTDLPNLPNRKMAGGREVITITDANGKARELAIVGEVNGQMRCQALDNGEYITLATAGSVALESPKPASTVATTVTTPAPKAEITQQVSAQAQKPEEPAKAVVTEPAKPAPVSTTTVVTTGNCNKCDCGGNNCGKPDCTSCGCKSTLQRRCEKDCGNCGKADCDSCQKCKSTLIRRCEKPGCKDSKNTCDNACGNSCGLFSSLGNDNCCGDLLSTIRSEERCKLQVPCRTHNHSMYRDNCDGSACSSGVCTGQQLPLVCCDTGGGILDMMKCEGSMINVPLPGLGLGSFNGIPNGPPAQPSVPGFCTINSTSVQRNLCGAEIKPFACLYQPFSPCMIDQLNRGMYQTHGYVEAEAIRNTCYLINVLRDSRDMANRQWAAERLCSATSPTMRMSVQDALVKAAANDRAPMVKVSAMKSLTELKMNTNDVMAIIFKNTQDSDPRVREQATLAMSELRSMPLESQLQQASYVNVVK